MHFHMVTLTFYLPQQKNAEIRGLIIKYLTSFYYNIMCQKIKTFFLFRHQCFSRKKGDIQANIKKLFYRTVKQN